MKVAIKNDQYERSRIVTLPFINLDPSNLSTIYTAQCEKHGLQVCPVTFNQPLYIKAAENCSFSTRSRQSGSQSWWISPPYVIYWQQHSSDIVSHQ